MSMLCDNCNGAIYVQAIGTIRNATFYFCSPQCRAEFAQFSGKIGHAMTIPDRVGEEGDEDVALKRERAVDTAQPIAIPAPAASTPACRRGRREAVEQAG